MREFLLLLIFCKVNFSAIYEEQKTVPKGEIVYTGEEPSKLSCVQKSLFYKADAIYDGRLCTCVKKGVDGDGDATVEHGVVGSAYSLVGDKNMKKYKMPESCQEIADREPLALSGLYTIRYSASKTIQVYCDIDRNLKVFTIGDNKKSVPAGWMLVANLSFTRTITKEEAKLIPGPVSSNIDELKNAATKNFLFDMSQLLQFPTDFKKIRIYCKRERTIHLMGFRSVVKYFIAKNNTCPASCGTFTRFVDDNSRLAGRCNEWKRKKWGCETSSLPLRMYYWPFFVAYSDSFVIYGDRIECDDRKTLGAGTWQIFVN